MANKRQGRVSGKVGANSAVREAGLIRPVSTQFAVLVVDRIDARAIHRQQLAPEKMAMVLKSGFKVRNSQMTSMLRWHSASSRRLDRTRLR